MVIAEVLIKAYAIIIFSIVVDENWNANNPRPYPNQMYYAVQWEEKDFYKNIYGQWVLRPKRKTDNELKQFIRSKYWEKIDV
jgi:hypothetical protein|tara:strand:- start:631 stop:876 length:246 start_codon:yes stop_codon:yes gene_type:complete